MSLYADDLGHGDGRSPRLILVQSFIKTVNQKNACGHAVMTKNLHTADLLAKLSLATLTILFYFIEAISGPFAVVLTSISIVVLLIYAVKAFISIKNEAE